MSSGFLTCLLSFYRLPAPSAASAAAVLGHDPRGIGGDVLPKQGGHGTRANSLGRVAHRAAGMDAPENTIGKEAEVAEVAAYRSL